MASFNFSFSGDDIEDTPKTEFGSDPAPGKPQKHVETGDLRSPKPSSAFPIAGQTLLMPEVHELETMLKALPSKIAYSTLVVKLDDGSEISIPRRELWDVRVQLMAEEDDEGLGNLGKDDVRTGVYEGGFKSWESSVDVVKVLHGRNPQNTGGRRKVLELGCGTALPSLAIFQWLLQGCEDAGLDLGLADYNPTVLQLVTLPNLLLSWAQITKKDWQVEGELEIDAETIQEFLQSLRSSRVTLSFFSGAWSPEFVELVSITMNSETSHLTIIGAETIYSPTALKSFAEAVLGLLDALPDQNKAALVAAKMVYFGVGGSMEDFCELMRERGRTVHQIREESDGVRRATIEVVNPTP